MTTRPASTPGPRTREMNLYLEYFHLVASGRKTIEVRVQYPNLRNLKPGDHIRFVCGQDECLTVVKRVARYDSFEQMIDGEVPEQVESRLPAGAAVGSNHLRRIYGPGE